MLRSRPAGLPGRPPLLPHCAFRQEWHAGRLRNIQRMAPDILDVVLAALSNPAAGFASVVKKVAQRIEESAGGGNA
jgi:hypothetical protein